MRSHVKNLCFVFHQGFQTPRNNKSTRPVVSCFHLFLAVWNPWWNTHTHFWHITTKVTLSKRSSLHYSQLHCLCTVTCTRVTGLSGRDENHFLRAVEHFFPVYIASSKDSGGWENSCLFPPKLCKSSTTSLVCITVLNSPSTPCVYMKLIRKHRKSAPVLNCSGDSFNLTMPVFCIENYCGIVYSKSSLMLWKKNGVWRYKSSLLLFDQGLSAFFCIWQSKKFWPLLFLNMKCWTSPGLNSNKMAWFIYN